MAYDGLLGSDAADQNMDYNVPNLFSLNQLLPYISIHIYVLLYSATSYLSGDETIAAIDSGNEADVDVDDGDDGDEYDLIPVGALLDYRNAREEEQEEYINASGYTGGVSQNNKNDRGYEADDES